MFIYRVDTGSENHHLPPESTTPTMPFLTLNQAAKASKKSKSALLNAIKNGRLSAARNDFNQWQIDPAELFRVYQAEPVATGSENHHLPHESTTPTTLATPVDDRVTMLEQQLKNIEVERDRERQLLRETIEDLRRRLDDEAMERRKLTALLTHQPTIQSVTGTTVLLDKLFRKK